MNVNAPFPGSARVSRAGFGVAPKRTLSLRGSVPSCELPRKVRDREDARAPRKIT